MSVRSSSGITGRLAPSPTGHLHLGHARTFLLAYWHVRLRAGRLLLRLEDLDGPRVKPEWIDATLRDLEWLGLDWDEAPLLQSSGLERFRAAADQLVASGQAYACVCTRADFRAAQSAPQLGDQEPRYPGTCRGRFASLSEAERLTGRAAALRFLVPPGELEIMDGIHGAFRADVQAEVGDFLVSRKDGSPAYQLAVVVDDAFQGVTEVLRGDDLLSSAVRQRHLHDALGLAPPHGFHVPLVLDADGKRLAKRHDSLSLKTLREAGVDPRAIVSWVARSAGQAADARNRASELVPSFDLARLPRTPVRLESASLAELLNARG